MAARVGGVKMVAQVGREGWKIYAGDAVIPGRRRSS
jgi:hypothetical protein